MFCASRSRHFCRLPSAKCFSLNPHPAVNTITVNSQRYPLDDWSNVTPKILSYLGRNLHLQKDHPLSIVRQRVVNHFYKAYINSRGCPMFSVYDSLAPVVSVEQNFDQLLIAKDHPSRAKSDCYYLNTDNLLRAHTTAHQVDLIKSGLDNFLVVGDVYRRDEIDATHYPVFHQLDGVRLIHREKLFVNNDGLQIFENGFERLKQPVNISDALKQSCHTLEAVKLTEFELKSVLVKLVELLFGKKFEYRWVETFFPFTHPSWELEILHNNQWLEVLGCGIMRHEILAHCGVKDSIGFAFGIGLERLAMLLYGIPDIRLFWSNDSGFLKQFDETKLDRKIKYKPVSVYPQCNTDLSFWLPENMESDQFVTNDLCDIARTIAGDTIEQIRLVDKYVHPQTKKVSLCYRITYRHMEKTLSQDEVNRLHLEIGKTCEAKLNIQVR